MRTRWFTMMLSLAAAATMLVSSEAEASAYYGYTVSNAQYVRVGNTYMFVFGATKPGQPTFMWGSDQNSISHEFVKDFVMTAILTGRKISVQCGVANGTACDFSTADVVWGTQVITGVSIFRVGTLKFDE